MRRMIKDRKIKMDIIYIYIYISSLLATERDYLLLKILNHLSQQYTFIKKDKMIPLQAQCGSEGG